MLTKRQESVLQYIVDDYIRTATPIGSDAIVRNHDLRVSSATIRNDVAELEGAGYITRPYSSSGSVPLDKGYRFYVESQVNLGVKDIPPRIRTSVRRQLTEVERDVDEWANVAAEILAGLVGNMAIATFPRAKESRVKHVELVHLQDLLLMLIVVLEQARLRRQLIRLAMPVESMDVEMSTNKINAYLMGLSRREIEAKEMVSLTPLEEEMVQAATSILREEEKAAYREHYVDGLRNLLNQPEFAENEKVRNLVGAVEDGTLIQAILDEIPDGGVVRVIIGQENRGDMLWPLSVVVCQYGIPNEAAGAVGAIGPTRMEYSRAISGVKFMSSVMSDMVGIVNAG